MFIQKKILYVVGVIAILAIGINIGWLARSTPTAPAPLYLGKVERKEQTAAAANANRPDETNTTPSSVSPSAPATLQSPPQPLRREDAALPLEKGGEEEARVVRVIDGDTIEVDINGKLEYVRYIGIDTPETVDPRKPVQCFGVEASKKNKELVEGKMVRLEKDITDRDKYNRLLRYVYLKPQINANTETQIDADRDGEIFVNLALVKQGFAKSYSYPPDVAYQDLFVAAERKARENKLGLWTACVSTTPAVSVTPTAAASASASNPSCAIKGNISASGEKIYHMQGCGSYAKTMIDESRGEQWFCSESESQSAGWRRALNCP